jgi:hypothetical protein
MDAIIVIPHHIAVSQKWMIEYHFGGELDTKIKIQTSDNQLWSYQEFLLSLESKSEEVVMEWDGNICSMDLSSSEEEEN